MIFSSAKFILLFLPIAFFGYFFLNRIQWVIAGKFWLVGVSLFFYAYWNILYLPLLLVSIYFNYAAGTALAPETKFKRVRYSRHFVLTISVAANLVLLGYFKYANFFIDNINTVFSLGYVLPQIVLPLGISFFTFTQIAYLVDSFQGKAHEYSFLNYMLFVTFFPHLIAGPILHHHEMMTQFESRWTLAVRYRNVLRGLCLFSMGLFKKVVIADTFAIWANEGFDHAQTVDFFSAWSTSLSYSFQLYFDFSGYSDMAMGASLLFNIWLPCNFNSPYKALDIQDFWRRWHMTLSRYLRDYLYIPLGGNRCPTPRIYFNLLTTFVLGGLWHGASWMFVIWGALHGLALVVQRIWSGFGPRMPKYLAWFLTFNFVNFTWIFFRAKSLEDAFGVIRGMVNIASIYKLEAINLPTEKLAWGGVFSDGLLTVFPVGFVGSFLCFVAITLAFGIISQKNSLELMAMYNERHFTKPYLMILLFCSAMYLMLGTKSAVFLYFNF